MPWVVDKRWGVDMPREAAAVTWVAARPTADWGGRTWPCVDGAWSRLRSLRVATDRVVDLVGITTRPHHAWMPQIGRSLVDAESGAMRG